MQTDRNNPHTRIDCANTQANTSDGAVVILAFIETVRFLRKDSAKTLSLICQLSANADNIANIRRSREKRKRTFLISISTSGLHSRGALPGATVYAARANFSRYFAMTAPGGIVSHVK